MYPEQNVAGIRGELTLLFEGDERGLRQFIEQHRETLERHQLMDDVNELAEELAKELDARYPVQDGEIFRVIDDELDFP